MGNPIKHNKFQARILIIPTIVSLFIAISMTVSLLGGALWISGLFLVVAAISVFVLAFFFEYNHSCSTFDLTSTINALLVGDLANQVCIRGEDEIGKASIELNSFTERLRG
jgi:signal transduction histidine kinase